MCRQDRIVALAMMFFAVEGYAHLGTCNNGYYKTYTVYDPAHIVYTVGYKTVDILIKSGVVKVEIYDELGNSAVYYM